MAYNETLIHQFYTAFQKKDYKTVQSLYHSDARFTDPVFKNLSAKEVGAMWQMLTTSTSDLVVTHTDVKANETHGSCRWDAVYTFSVTGRKVHNIVTAEFTFKDGKIFRHKDHFDFWRWSRMALGLPGLLLGWTPIIANKIRNTARARLNAFLAKNTQA